MISLETRKRIFVKYFIEFQSYRSISKDLDLNRSTVTKVCKEAQKKIREMNLIPESNLMDYIDKIVVQPRYKRGGQKVNAATKRLIKGMVISNEIKRTRYPEKSKTLTQLYSQFKTKEKYDKDGNNIYITDITYNNFYKIVKKIKEGFS